MGVRTEPIDKRVRAYVGATAVVDSRTPLLFWEETFPVPAYAFPADDVRMDLLRPASGDPADAPFFYRPKGPGPGCSTAGWRRRKRSGPIRGTPTRYYVPRADVRIEALAPSDNQSLCPYKGEAHEYWDAVGPPVVRNVAWSYWAPLPAVQQVAGLVAFYDELIDLTVDGEQQERPVSPFSEAAHRPGT